MKAVILAGGLGTRIAEETSVRPKPMIEIGGRPIIWHLMKIYSHFGINDFIVCCGYKGYVIKEYFSNYFLHMSDVSFDLSRNALKIHHQNVEPWVVTLVDTGESTMTGGRLRRVARYIQDEESFCFTYGDGLSNVNVTDLIDSHNRSGCVASLTAVYPPGRFGSIEFVPNDPSRVNSFREKPKGDGAMVNGGFFVLSPDVLTLIKDDSCVWEAEPLETLAREGNLNAYKHLGFWQPMDTLRDKNYLESLWQSGDAPWKVWPGL